MAISLIVAMTKDRVIGNNGKIPWKISQDLKLFKQITSGGIVIMGRKTWESLPQNYKPLSNRKNIVVSSQLKSIEGIKIYNDLECAIKNTRESKKEVYLIGGASIYEQGINLVNKMHISLVKGSPEGDTYFPKFDKNDWEIIEKKYFKDFTYKLYKRK